jgi:hypothetical protein
MTLSSSQPSTLDKILGTVSQLGTTYAQVYQAAKLTEQPGAMPAMPAAQPAPAIGAAAPWYKAPWVIPAGIGAGVLLLLALFMPSRRR